MAEMRYYTSAKHRFFDYLVTFLGSLCCLGVGLGVHRLGKCNLFYNRDRYLNIQGIPNVSNLEFHFHPYDLLDSLANNSWPTVVELYEFPLGTTGHKPSLVRLTGEIKLTVHLIESAFINYYESVCAEVETIYGKDKKLWPPVWSFGRVVRNAFAHDGEIYFRNRRASAVAWKTLSYSPTDNDRQIIYRDLAPVEIILLMDDMDSAI